MRTLNIGILGDGDVERSVSDYYRKERLAMCNLNPRDADRDWEHFFTANDGMILDFHNNDTDDRLLVTAILTATRNWHSRVIVLAEDYQNCWEELKAIDAKPLMVIPRPVDGSTEYHGYCVDLYRAANEITAATQPETPDPEDRPAPSGNSKRSVAPLFQLVGALLVAGGLVGLMSSLIVHGWDLETIGGGFITMIGALISTGVTMLGGPKLQSLASRAKH